MKSVAFIKLTALVSLLIIGLVIGCTDPPTKPDIDEEIDPPNIIVSVFPDIGTNLTEFQPSLLIVTESDSVIIGDGYQVRCDYDGDGVPDTDWLNDIPSTPTFQQYGPHELVLEIRDSLEIIDTSTCTIYVQELIQITPTNTSGFGQYNVDWARDGSNRMAYDSHGGDNWAYQSIFSVQYREGDIQRVSFHPDSTNYHFDQYPEWSPNGSTISCQSSLGLSLIDVESGERTVIDSHGHNFHSAWSPDGDRIAYSQGGATVIQTLETGRIDTLIDAEVGIGWSPDGAEIATTEIINPSYTRFRIHDATDYAIIESFLITARGFKVDYSPDGRWISVDFGIIGVDALLIDTESSKLLTLSADGLTDPHSLSWNHDGTMLGFSARPDRVDQVWDSIWAIEFPVAF
jgi:hypothetical protein